jgi:hypothetical protein
MDTSTNCGTHNGYIRHLRHREPTCDICRTAHAIYVRERRQATKPTPERTPQ